ncbi:MAG: hypothetical protein ABEH83_04845 [Halobacterium sp.]
MVPAALSGLPGGMELAVMASMLVLFAGFVFAVVAGGRRLFGDGASERRVEELESRVDELEAEVTDDGSDDAA